MARIEINDLPISMKISTDEMRRVCGGMFTIFHKTATEVQLHSATSLVKSDPARSLGAVFVK